jgi:protein gp37
MNNVKKSIGWADYTWNPITGCKRGCEYCYARRIHERFYKTPFSDIVLHQERLRDPDLTNKPPSKIFVGSMSDIQFWKTEDTVQILDLVKDTPNHTFMFLSKNPLSYAKFIWPENTMQGLTLTCDGLRQKYIVYAIEQFPRPFISIEPLLGTLTTDINTIFGGIELVIVGAMTGPGKIKPRPEWIQSIKDHVPTEKIFWKSNIKEYL